MKNLDMIVYSAFIYGSIIPFIISLFSTGEIAYGGQLAGYSILTIGILLILTLMIYFLSKGEKPSVFNLIMATGPYIFMLGVIGFMLYLLIKYKSIIINNQVSPNYKTFSNITLILLISQTILTINNINSESFKIHHTINKLTSSLLYLLSVISLGSALILYVILKYYTTDG